MAHPARAGEAGFRPGVTAKGLRVPLGAPGLNARVRGSLEPPGGVHGGRGRGMMAAPPRRRPDALRYAHPCLWRA